MMSTNIDYHDIGDITSYDTQHILLPSSIISKNINFTDAVTLLDNGAKNISLKLDATAMKTDKTNMNKFLESITF